MTLSQRMSAILMLALIAAGRLAAADAVQPMELASPDGRIQVSVRVEEHRRPEFRVSFRGVPVAAGTCALEFAGSGLLGDEVKVVRVRRASRDETYLIPVGKASSARDHHNELLVSLEETKPLKRKLDLVFRVFDDGVAFRYVIPEQTALTEFALADEHTRFTFSGEPNARSLPLKNYTTPYEWYYQTLPVSKLDPRTLIGLPLLLEPRGEAKAWLAATEAGLTDYAGMYLSAADGKPGEFAAKLSPLPGRKDGAKVIGKAPFASPWRVLMIADDPGRLIESNIVFHLNDPPAFNDSSWIKPGKTTFPWWNGYVLDGVDFKPGVNTATMKYYIDFCAEQGIPYHSLDGIDIAWYGGPIDPRGPTDVTKAAPSIDLAEVLRHAKAKGIRLRLWMHWKALKPQIDEAFATYEKWGIEGAMVDFMDRDDQEMVRFYHEMASKAAKHHLTLTLHGAYKPTGMERTWPNVLTYEAVLNQEYNKWQPPGVKGTPPAHNLDVAFVRMLAGPLDYHQGGMRSVLPAKYAFRDLAPPVQGTRGHQLAMYVVYQNHLPMMADSPTTYRGQPGLDFMVEVPTNWDETRVLHAKVGESIIIARRRGENWYLGGMTAAHTCELNLPLKFLGGGNFDAKLYFDDPARGPNALAVENRSVSSANSLRLKMPVSGGFAADLKRRK